MNGNLSAEERALLRGRQVRREELESLRGWYPVVAADDGLWWRFFGEKKFSEPFFHDTVCGIPQTDRLCLHTAFDAPAAFGETLAPDAFIFHVSRCGSTLLTQMLATLPGSIVMSEPPVIDSVLRRHYEGREQDETARVLKSAVAALGQRRFSHERQFFVKLDSWHILSLPLFRRAFPATPFVFLYRRPDEVLASHRRQRGRQMVPGLVDAAMPEFEFPMPDPHDLDGRCERMLQHFFSAACRHAEELILVNYSQLPHIVWEDMLDFFSVTSSPQELDVLKASAGRHSKNGVAYSGDPQAALGSEPCADILHHYEQLETLRLRQGTFRPGNGRVPGSPAGRHPAVS